MLTFQLSSCLKEEPLRNLPPPGPEKKASLDLGDDYSEVIYFDLSDGSSEKRKLDAWDLSFSSADSLRPILLNGGKEIQGFKTTDTSFHKKINAGLNSAWAFDHPAGLPDSLLFSGVVNQTGQSNGRIYILDLGKNNSHRYIKFRAISESSTAWTFEWCIIGDTIPKREIIYKDKAYSRIYFLFNTGIVPMEPPAKEWDLVFTRYRHIYFDMVPVTGYYVVGAILNSTETFAQEDSVRKWTDIKAATLNMDKFHSRLDEIGFDWKIYNFSTERYEVIPYKNYLIKTSKGELYKLNFYDFYSNSGMKGSPSFIYQKL